MKEIQFIKTEEDVKRKVVTEAGKLEPEKVGNGVGWVGEAEMERALENILTMEIHLSRCRAPPTYGKEEGNG